MFNKMISLIHVFPLLLIVALSLGVFMYQLIANVKVNFSITPTVLLLASIGVTSGFLLHHAQFESFGSCYACIGYGFVLAVAACRMMFVDRRVAA